MDLIVEKINFLSFIGLWMISFVGSFSKFGNRQGDLNMVVNQVYNMTNQTTLSIMVWSNQMSWLCTWIHWKCTYT
jgi:hypothetical protein